jgi:hypothetical protein
MNGLLDDLDPDKQWEKKPAVKAEPKIDPLESVLGLDAPTEAQMLAFYDDPASRPKGETTHIEALDPIFKWVPGWVNVKTAFAGVGKGEFTRQELLLRAALAGKKSLGWVPEDMPREAYYDALIHSLTGQDPNPESLNPLSRARYVKAMEWVREHFYVVQPVKGQGKTPAHLLDIFEAARVKLNISHFAIDPWHKLDHSEQRAGGEVAYLNRELDRVTTWTQEAQVYLTVTRNPKRINRAPNEAWPVPDSDHLSGGEAWNDFAGTITAYDRPNRHAKGGDPAFAIYTRKIKNHRRANAKPGSIGEGSENPDVLVEFDWKTGRYLFNGVAPLAHPTITKIYAPELVDASGSPVQPATPRPLPASTFEDEAPRPVGFPTAATGFPKAPF